MKLFFNEYLNIDIFEKEEFNSLDLENQEDYKRNDMFIAFDSRYRFYGKGLFSMYNIEYYRHGDFGLFTQLDCLNFSFMQYIKAKELKDYELEKLIGLSTFTISCKIPLSDVSKYSKFDLEW